MTIFYFNGSTNYTNPEDWNALGTLPYGSIIFSDQPIDGDTLTIDNTVFEFDNNNSITNGNIAVSIGNNLATTLSTLKTLIESSSLSLIVTINNTILDLVRSNPIPYVGYVISSTSNSISASPMNDGMAGNWWTDENYTQPASALPTTLDSIVITTPLTTNSALSTPTIASVVCSGTLNYIGINLIVTGLLNVTESAYIDIGASITCGSALFSNYAYNMGTITATGGVTFSYFTYNSGPGVVNGNCEFVESSNSSLVNGYCSFSAGSSMWGNDLNGIINGQADFYGTTANFGSIISPSGSVRFYETCYHGGGTINADVEFYDSASLDGGTVIRDVKLYETSAVGAQQSGSSVLSDIFFYNSARLALDMTVGGKAYFYNSSYIGSGNDDPSNPEIYVLTGNAEFRDTSIFYGKVTGNAYIFGSGVSLSNIGGTTVNGTAFFDYGAALTQIKGQNTLGSIKIPAGVNGSNILGIL